jgi:hypothetical protein
MDRIYLVDGEQLVSMTQEGYINEDRLQELLADYLDLMTPEQIGDAPRRWLLISRETPVPDQEEYLYGRWSLDHLFLDQDGIPTLVEVKRSTDTRIRREVVGQMLDYAANAVTYWKIEELRVRFEAQYGGLDSDTILQERLGVASSAEFWERVETNLRAGKIRMLFVADEIPPELRRIVEFLNEQMTNAEVLAIAIRQYVGQERQMLVPTLYGQTAKAQGAKSSGGPKVKWTEETFFAAMGQDKRGHQTIDVARRILHWAQDRELAISWGAGEKQGSFSLQVPVNGELRSMIGIWTYGKVEIQFEYMRSQAPFGDDALRLQLLKMLNAIPGLALPPDSINRRPTFDLAVVYAPAHFDQFIAVLDWFVEIVRRHASG